MTIGFTRSASRCSALMSYSGSDDAPDLGRLRERLNSAWSVWQGSPYRYTEISEVLPDLIIDAQAAQRGLAHGSPDERREGQRISADLSFLLRTFTKRIGRTDLSLLVADRGGLAAEAGGDPVRMAAAKCTSAISCSPRGTQRARDRPTK